MRHLFAQMSVAVTSRALLVALDALGVDPDVAYVVALWGPVLGSAGVVEVLSVRALASFTPLSSLAGRIRRELTSLAAGLRVRALARSFVRIGR